MKNLKTNTFIYCLFSLVAIIAVLIPEIATASSPFDSVDEKGNEIASWASGSLWTWLSTIAVIVVTAGAFFGKINWPTAISVIVAIVVGFNAGNIVGLLNS